MKQLAQKKTFVILAIILLYYALSAAGALAMRYIGDAQYSTPAMLPWVFHRQIIDILFLSYVTRRFFAPNQIGLGTVKGKRRWLDMGLVITPIVLASLFLIIWLSRLSPHGLAQIDKGILVTGIPAVVMVGITEEWMFRGLMFHYFSTKKEWCDAISRAWETIMARGFARHDWSGAINKAIGIGVSAILFSLSHATNLISGYPASAVGYQLIGTLAFGVVFGALASWLPSIRPLMAWHFLWDYSMIIGGYLSTFN